MHDLNIEPLEELEITTKVIHEKIGRYEVDTIMTRRKGLHWLTEMSGERVLVDESATMDSGEKLGTTLCFTPHKDIEVSEEERAANRELIKKAAIKAMIDRGIW
ncbi:MULTISPECIES: hypothetical protein [Oscillospiraceae]|uniref:hypothetical protein n=1 Tax=Oscillospiraceae TaxID=216572 RepID=UPI000B36F35F|nr:MULTISPECIES: hypothetical protein [Oscillospiraceae]MBM6723555.1 hypothetical protein [Pseudoflavonifractor phocaeensis]MBM6886973.1 hypothetical protein [Pseudoflavonifractor phocaeensis]OUO33268.1 hypothetical protein B5F88_16750 [Flavonifractor sp. An306]HJC00052.1 hypothetical protein [Candidatus Flavonifractor merdavium]